jgi:PAS domain S-box-containing protein
MTTPLRVLIVEDSPDDAELMALRLAEEGFQPEWRQVQTEPDYLAALEAPPDLILADWSLPQFSGLRALQLARERDLDVPFVIVSGSIGEEAAIEALRLGASDYVLKDRPVRLGQAVTHALEEKRVRDEKRQAEQALRESEKRLQEAQALGRIGNWEFDVDSQTIAWSDQVYRLYERDPALGPPTADEEAAYYPPEQAERLREYARRAIEEGQEFAYDLQVKLPGGKLAHFSVTMRPVKDESGRAVKLFGTVQDITERKQAEEALRRRTRSLALIDQANRAFSSSLNPNQVFAIVLEEARRLLDISASSIWLVDPETQELVCHQATGHKSKSVVGWRLAPGEGIAGWVATHGESLIVPDVEADERHSADVNRHIGLAVRSILSVPLRSKQSVIGVLQMLDTPVGRFSAEDLETLEPLAAAAAIAIENARLYQQAQREIDERKRAEEALRESEEKYRLLVENATVGIVVAQGTTLRYYNPQAMSFTGSSPDDLASTPFAEYIHPDDRETTIDYYLKFLRGEETPATHNFRIISKQGQIKWLESNAILVTWEGRPATLNFLLDITERKQAAAALQRYVERLRILRTIDGVILAAQSPQDVGLAIVRHLQRLVPSDRLLISSFDLEEKQATVLASLAGDGTWLEAGTQIDLEAFGSIDNLQMGRVSIVGDARTLEAPPGQSSTLLEDARSYLHIPLIAQGTLVGSLLMVSDNPAAFTTEHMEIADELSGQLAIGIHQVRLREQIRRHTDELEQQVAARTAQLARRTTQLQVAAEVARDATTARDLDELLNRSVNLVRDRFGFYHAGIFLTDERGEYAVLRAATGDAGRQMLEHEHKLKVGEVGIVGHVCASGEPRIALDTGADAVYFDNPFLPDTRSEMALPMRASGNVIGALDVQSTKESAFDQDDVEILQVMADQLAMAIERTRLFKRAQATLEERLQTVISNTPVILFAMNREGVFTLLEGKGLEVLKVNPGEFVGQSAIEILDSVSVSTDGMRRALAGEASAETVESNGLAFDVWYTPLRDEDGEVVGVIGAAVDTTERHRMQEQMQRQERLAAVGQLAGGIAHDFNNFLMTIIFYAHLLLRDKDTSPDVASIAETIAGEANRAAALVRQVLDFSRRSVMETEPVDLSSFVREVVDILQKTLPENIRVVTEVGQGDYVVTIDPTRIQQVIMNLALNSRDAMPNGGNLRIELSRVTVDSTEASLPGIPDLELAAGDWVCLSVQDTGTGMDEHVRAHLFEPFFTTKGPKGNGLGLAQVYGIVKQHGGEIGVETKVDQGTKFQIYLPAYRSNDVEGIASEEAATVPEGRGETILFVEDEDRVRDVGQRVLQSLGYRVLTASNGKEALEVFQNKDVDLVLTDMVMPEMGGRELIQELKRIAPAVKALVVTGYTMQEEVRALKDSGFADIVYKPLNADVLGRTVRRILDAEQK